MARDLAVWSRLGAMTDSAAAQVDQRLRPPRQGDGDDGRALLLDPLPQDSWASLLSLGEALRPARLVAAGSDGPDQRDRR